MASFCQLISMKNNILKKKYLQGNHVSRMRYEVGRSCSFTPFSCLGTISSPHIVQMTSKFGTCVHQHMAKDVSTIPCQVGLKFFKNIQKNPNFGIFCEACT